MAERNISLFEFSAKKYLGVVRTGPSHERPGQLAYLTYSEHRGEYSLEYADRHTERGDKHPDAPPLVLLVTAEEALEDRMKALQVTEYGWKDYVVALVAENTNAFGLYGHILMDRDGETYEAAAGAANKRHQGQVLRIQTAGLFTVFSALGFELAQRLPEKAPLAVIKEAWDNAE